LKPIAVLASASANAPLPYADAPSPVAVADSPDAVAYSPSTNAALSLSAPPVAAK